MKLDSFDNVLLFIGGFQFRMQQERACSLTQQLPLPASMLQKQLTNMPDNIKSPSLTRNLTCKNKEMILNHFAELALTTANVCAFEFAVHPQVDFKDLVKRICDGVLADYPNNGQGYANRIREANLSTDSNRQFLHQLLTQISQAHIQNFQLQQEDTCGQSSEGVCEEIAGIVTCNLSRIFPLPPAQHPISPFSIAPEKDATLTNNLEQLGELDQVGSQVGEQVEEQFDQVTQHLSMLIRAIRLEETEGHSANLSQNPLADVDKSGEFQDNELLQTQEPELGIDEIIKEAGLPNQRQKFNTDFPEFWQCKLAKKEMPTLQEQHSIMHFTDLIFNQDSFEMGMLRVHPTLDRLSQEFEHEINLLFSHDTAFKHTRNISILKYKRSQFETEYDRKVREQVEQMQTNRPATSPAEESAPSGSPSLFSLARSFKHRLIKHKDESQKKKIQPNQNPQFRQKFVPDPHRNPEQQFQSCINDLQACWRALQPYLQEGVGQKIGGMHYESPQEWVIITIYAYWNFVAKSEIPFCPLKRRTLISIYKRLLNRNQKPSPQFTNWKFILKYLENNRPEIRGISPSSVVSRSKQVIKTLYQNLADRETMNNIFEDGLESFRETLPELRLVCLSTEPGIEESSVSCKVIHLLISGFLSEDMDKEEQWRKMVKTMPGCEIYALSWKSSTICNLAKFVLRSAKDILSASKMKQELRRKYQDNPFNPAFQVARMTGRLLAELTIRLFPDRFINVCGYSLGTEVIKQFLYRLIRSEKEGLLNRIFLMGGVSDVGQFQQIISRSLHSLSISNCFSRHDKVLKHLLSLCKPEILPVGINKLAEIPGHDVSNVDCSKFISGHLKFRSHLDLMSRVLQMNYG